MTLRGERLPDDFDPDDPGWGGQSTMMRGRIALLMTVTGIALLVAGAAVVNVFVVGIGYIALMFSLVRSRALLREIDDNQLPPDGRPYASFAWMLGMVGSGLSILAFAKALFRF